METHTPLNEQYTRDLVNRFAYFKTVLGEERAHERFLAARKALSKQVMSESLRQQLLADYWAAEQQLFPK
jgi:hypothetical protein